MYQQWDAACLAALVLILFKVEIRGGQHDEMHPQAETAKPVVSQYFLSSC